MNPYLILAALLALVGSGTAGYWKGHHDAALACEVDKAALRQASQDRKDAQAEKAVAASVILEHDNAQAQVVYQTITKTVDRVVARPVYRNVCLDDDGLRAANAALARAHADPGQPDGAVSGPEPAR